MKLRTGLLLTGTFALGLAAGALAPAIHEALADARPGESTAMTYEQLSLYGKIFERVKADYVTPEPSRKLVYDSINGMLAGLDPHSGYMNKGQYKDMQVETTGHFGGLGLEVSETEGFIRVISPIDGTPAARAGIKPNDLIVDINGRTTDGLTLDKAVHAMRGPVGSKIVLTIKRAG
ncbi:MAG TPA: PDZ domain-containing protein, partial [Acetobacteraceae bacterium]|nr:PDZ domain-containing protein [Acetobacteraceae bacterium]